MERLTKGLDNGNMADAADALSQLGQSLEHSGQQLTPEQQKALSEALKSLSDALKHNPQALKNLQQALKGLKQGTPNGQKQAGQALKDMNLSKAELDALARALAEAKNAKSGITGNTSAHGKCPSCGKSGCNGNCAGTGQSGQGGTQPGGAGQNNSAVGALPGGTPGTAPGSGPGMVNSAPPGHPLQPGLTPHGTGSQLDPSERALSIDANLRGAPGATGDSTVPYYDVYPDYAARAETAINADNIPVNERKRVKDYFGALDPNAGNE